jgi:Family of unknown function (DUF695)/Regulator of ribonuclease activity B
MKYFAVTIVCIAFAFCAPAQTHTPAWDTYLRENDSSVYSVMVDLGWVEKAPVKQQTLALYIALEMLKPYGNGLPSYAEKASLDSIEDALVAVMGKKYKATYTGRISGNGLREFYFYARDSAGFNNEVAAVMQAFPAYSYQPLVVLDNRWRFYFSVLYPTAREMEWIQNRRLTEVLLKNKDNPSLVHDIDHWVYFSTPKDRIDFLEAIKEKQFTIVRQDFISEKKGTPYRVHLARKDKTEFAAINTIALYLYDKAIEHKGLYDGWETKVMK